MNFFRPSAAYRADALLRLRMLQMASTQSHQGSQLRRQISLIQMHIEDLDLSYGKMRKLMQLIRLLEEACVETEIR